MKPHTEFGVRIYLFRRLCLEATPGHTVQIPLALDPIMGFRPLEVHFCDCFFCCFVFRFFGGGGGGAEGSAKKGRRQTESQPEPCKP